MQPFKYRHKTAYKLLWYPDLEGTDSKRPYQGRIADLETNPDLGTQTNLVNLYGFILTSGFIQRS